MFQSTRCGEQIGLEFGRQRAVVMAVGATLREYTVDGRPVLDGFGPDEVSPAGRGQVLMPWPNRVRDGHYEFGRTHHELPIDEPPLGNAIHGLVRWAGWVVDERAVDCVRLRYRLRAQPGYPFELDVFADYRLSSAGLEVTFGATNIGSEACPFGAGAHPYFGFAGQLVDEVELCVRADDWLEVDSRCIPFGHCPVEGSAIDFRRPRVIGGTKLDHAFTRLERGHDGIARFSLRHGRDEIRAWQDESFAFVQVYTADTLPDRARRRHSVAVEPMTCAPDAFNSGDGLRVLAPGDAFRGSWGVSAW
jgi:aldose 1-epimerase